MHDRLQTGRGDALLRRRRVMRIIAANRKGPHPATSDADKKRFVVRAGSKDAPGSVVACSTAPGSVVASSTFLRSTVNADWESHTLCVLAPSYMQYSIAFE